ncbi:hypothetical protein M404DRAFT_1002596 [Pisolithus tinctorius Marx 270]|uniref:Uncharacterized protein n=1 Tax=Pisolithus tinctorius Marx 270 TaxID=870435 RepID=A0A0C3P3X9_PISTI|nr:hypothetical protein M404DRAFT_1002596 [Pisolithus tinctorius Marx 270]
MIRQVTEQSTSSKAGTMVAAPDQRRQLLPSVSYIHGNANRTSCTASHDPSDSYSPHSPVGGGTISTRTKKRDLGRLIGVAQPMGCPKQDRDRAC